MELAVCWFQVAALPVSVAAATSILSSSDKVETEAVVPVALVMWSRRKWVIH